jgi:hypothetical protein
MSSKNKSKRKSKKSKSTKLYSSSSWQSFYLISDEYVNNKVNAGSAVQAAKKFYRSHKSLTQVVLRDQDGIIHRFNTNHFDFTQVKKPNKAGRCSRDRTRMAHWDEEA